MELIRGISGIRGIVGKSLTEPVIIKHIQAFSAIQSAGDILLARDSRTHGESFIHTAAEALSKCGRNVIVYDIIPFSDTPLNHSMICKVYEGNSLISEISVPILKDASKLKSIKKKSNKI